MNKNLGKRTGVEEPFALVSDGYNDFFGGRQEWFPEDYRPNIHKYGCGIVAAVNVYIYLAGIKMISRADYMALVREFLDMYPFSSICLDLGLGVFPWQMSSYIKKKCYSAGVRVKAGWQGREGVDSLYEKMKVALDENTPVIWAFFNLHPSSRLQFYKFIGGEFRDTYLSADSREHRYDEVNSHYVTVTAVYEREIDEKLERWVEISSWGARYYVNYDEFKTFVRNAGGIFNPANLINGYCSNILIIKKR